jgi:recombination protein RecT
MERRKDMKTDGSDHGEKSLERSPVQSLKDLLNSDYVKNRFLEVMGEKATAFLASVLNAIQKTPELAKCDQGSLLSSAMVAATLDLPIDSNLGFSAIIPYRQKMIDKKTKEEYYITLAQFQIMYKGFIQLALRSGQYKTINVSPIYEDEFESYDIITGDMCIHPVAGGFREQENYEKIIGYVAFFRLINGFERIEYWSLSKIKAHGKKHSKSFRNPSSLWNKDPHAMYAKTVLKNTLSKWGILSVTMQNAVTADQAVLKDFRKSITEENLDYVDAQTDEDGETENADEAVTEEKPPEQSAGTENGTPTEETEKPTKESEKPEKEPETKPEVKAETPKENGKPQDGLFTADEEKDLEKLNKSNKSNYPDFEEG